MLYWLHINEWSWFPQVISRRGRWQGVVRVYANRSVFVTHQCTCLRPTEALARQDACVAVWQMAQCAGGAHVVAFEWPELDNWSSEANAD